MHDTSRVKVLQSLADLQHDVPDEPLIHVLVVDVPVVLGVLSQIHLEVLEDQVN